MRSQGWQGGRRSLAITYYRVPGLTIRLHTVFDLPRAAHVRLGVQSCRPPTSTDQADGRVPSRSVG